MTATARGLLPIVEGIFDIVEIDGVAWREAFVDVACVTQAGMLLDRFDFFFQCG